MTPVVALQAGVSLPFDLEKHKNARLEVFVDRSAAGINGADLLLDNVLKCHAVIFQKRDNYNNGDKTWWIKPASPDAELFIDKVRVCDDAVLLPGHVLSFVAPESGVYGKSLKLSITADGKLVEPPDGEIGVSLRCKGLVANGIDEDGRPKRLLDKVSFEIKKGEFVGIIGPSGCGKSSLLERLAGIGDWEEGSIWVNGRNLREAGDEFVRQRVFVVQDAAKALHDDLTIQEELDAVHRMHTVACEEDAATDEYAIRKFHLDGDEFKSKAIGKYSGGEKRRAALARALSLKPRLLLLDEPTAGLDSDREREVMNWLKEISGPRDSGRSGCTILCVTHVLANADLFDRLLVFSKGGKLVFSGTPEETLDVFRKAYPEGNGKDAAPIASLAGIFPLLSGDEPIRKNVLDECPEIAEPTVDEFPPAREKASPGRCAGGYFKCLWRSLTRTALSKCIFDFLLFPALLAMVIRFVCNDYAKWFREGTNLPSGSEPFVLPFCSCLAVFWIGLVSSVRDFVGERYPRRCLESREGVPLMPYLAARYLWRLATVGLQAVSFSLAMMLALWIGWRDGGGVWVSWLTILPLVLSAWTGTLLGLTISAFATSPTSAVGKVPYFAIAQLLFSKVVLDGDNYPIIIKFVKSIMPCDKTIESLKLLWFGRPPEDNVLGGTMWSIGFFAVYAVLLVAFGIMAQRQREIEWTGR